MYSLTSRTLALVFLLSASCKTTDQNRLLNDTQSTSTDQVNLSDPDSRVDAILTLAEREPRLPVGPNGFPRDPWEVMDLMEQLYSQSKAGLHPTVIPKNSVQYQYAYEGADYKINDAAVDQVKRELEANKRSIEDALGRPLHSMAKDTLALKEKIAQNKLDPQLLTKMLAMIPVAYSSSTEEYLAAERAITELTHSDLANLYKDTYPEHLAGEIRKYFAESVINSFENQFINKKLAAALEYLKGASGKVPKMVLLEEISGFTGVFRACFGNDCSLRSVPFYALDEKAKVYLIRSHQGGGVKGYVLVTEATVDGKSYPYIVTINGSMSADQVRASVSLVASVLKAPAMVLPDFEKAGAIVNTSAMREGMAHESAKRSVTVTMNPNWQRISTFTAENNKSGYSNYYAPASLSTAYLGAVTPVRFATETLKDVFKSGLTIRAKPLLERAKIAAMLQGNLEGKILSRVIATLGVSDEQMRAAKPLLSVDDGLSKAEYDIAKQVLGFGKADIQALHPLARARVLSSLSEHQDELVEIEFAKEGRDFCKWALSQLVATSLPVENVGAYKQNVWNAFVDLSGRVPLADEVVDSVVKVRPDAETKALSELIRKGFYPPKILSSIVRSGARDDLNKADSKGYTPLMLAVINGHDDLVRTLLAAGADPSVKNNLGEDASTLAKQLERSEMFKDVPNGGTTESEFRKSDGGSCDLLQRKLEQ